MPIREPGMTAHEPKFTKKDVDEGTQEYQDERNDKKRGAEVTDTENEAEREPERYSFDSPEEVNRRVEAIEEHELKVLKEYREIMERYKAKVKEIRKIEKRSPGGLQNKEIASAIRLIDEERHNIHLELIDFGERLGKDKETVLIDIIRQDCTLEDFGLPEFSISTDEDIITTKDWHNPYYFNVDAKKRRPSKTSSTKGTTADYRWDRFRQEEAMNNPIIKESEEAIKYDEVMIVFAIVPVDNDGYDNKRPDDFSERQKRAQALAEAVGGKTFQAYDSAYHEGTAEILGVTIPKEDLEKVATIIRENPNKFRIGEQYYSDSKKEELTD